MKKIIIADDNRTFLMYLGLLLRRFDLKVLPAENGLEVLRLLNLARADIVLLDVHMKGMDGFTALRHIKEDKRTAHLPVIMVSCDASNETEDRCRGLGCFDYLTKPLKVDKLHYAIQRHFFSHRGTNRKHLRAPYNGKVVLSHGGTEYGLYAETLSEGGMYVVKEEPLPVGSEVVVKYDLGERGKIEVKGSVIYKKELFGDFLTLPPGMAVKFHGLTIDEARSIKYYVEDLMSKAIFDDGQNRGLFER